MFFTNTPQSSRDARPTENNIWTSEDAATPHTHPIALIDQRALEVSGSGSLRARTVPLCRFYLSGGCRSGINCEFSHSEWHDSSYEGLMCEICSENVVANHRKFGLLESCEHVFCLNCIREWRNQKDKQDRLNLRKCPICRIDSFLIIPSDEFLTGDAKMAEKETYCKYLATIPCKHFDQGKGTCQFGTSCLYRHPAVSSATPDTFTLIRGASGTTTKKLNTLADFMKL